MHFSPGKPVPRRHFQRWIIALLVLAALVPFARAAFFPFVYDDRSIVRSNPDLRGWSALLTVWAKPYWNGAVDAGFYRPAFVAVLAAAWNLGARLPIWFHLLAIGMHAFVTVSVWWMLRRAVAVLPATLAALWFAVLPVHIEAVANVANSSEVLVALWSCVLALYLARLDWNVPAERAVPWGSALAAGAIFLATFLSKESGIVAPFAAAVWVWGWRPPARTARHDWRLAVRLLRERWWRVVIVLIVAAAIVFVARRLVLGSFLAAPIAPGLASLTAWQRIWGMLSLGPLVAQILVWPAALNPEYGPNTLKHLGPSWAALATLLILTAALALSIRWARRGDRRLLAALGWFVITFGPASNLISATPQILTERTLYGPSIAFSCVSALLITVLIRRIDALADRRTMLPARALARAGVVAVVITIIVATGVKSLRASAVWSSNEAVFRQMIAVDSAGYRGYWKLAAYMKSRNQLDESLALYERAYRLYPDDRQLAVDFAQALLDQHEASRAATVSRTLMQFPDLRRNPGVVSLYLAALGQAYGADSVIHAGGALFADDQVAMAALFVGAAHESRGEMDAAEANYRAGLRIAPGDTALQHRLDSLRDRGLR
jgi:tetratricopeptide (TPR) repeat protein